MAIIRFKSSVRNSMAQQVIDALDAGAGPGKLRFYTGTIPTTGDASITTQTLLGTLTCSDPSATISAGVVTFGAIAQDSSADASGTASFAALVDSDGGLVCYLDVSNEAGTGAIKLDDVNIIAGGRILMTGLAITVGA